MTDYEKICDFQNLYQAHLRARRGKRAQQEVAAFETNLSENLVKMSEALKKRAYQMSGYYHFTIYEPKQREIYAAYYPDRVMLHCVCDEVLMPLLERRLIYDNAACRKGKGNHFAIKRTTYFLREHYARYKNEGYILKCDIASYFASIDHEVLKHQLKRLAKDPDIRNLLYQVIDSYETEGRPGKGLPFGNQSSVCFAIYYLDPLDRLIKEKLRVKHYIRYMDDFLLIHHDKEFLQECLRQIRALLEDTLKLELNAKTQLFPIKNGVEFLGWRFYLTETGKVIRKMKQQSKLRFKRRLKKLQRDYENGSIELQDVKASLASYKGHLMHGHTYRLRANAFGHFVLRRNAK